MTVKPGWLLLGLVVLAVIAGLAPRLSAQALQSPVSPPYTPLPWRPTPAVEPTPTAVWRPTPGPESGPKATATGTPTAMSGTPALMDAPLRPVRRAVKIKVVKVRWSYQAK